MWGKQNDWCASLEIIHNTLVGCGGRSGFLGRNSGWIFRRKPYRRCFSEMLIFSILWCAWSQRASMRRPIRGNWRSRTPNIRIYSVLGTHKTQNRRSLSVFFLFTRVENIINEYCRNDSERKLSIVPLSLTLKLSVSEYDNILLCKWRIQRVIDSNWGNNMKYNNL